MTGYSKDLLDIRPVVGPQNGRVWVGVFVKKMIDFLGKVPEGVPQRQKSRGRVENAPEVEIEDVSEFLLGFEEFTQPEALKRERHGSGGNGNVSRVGGRDIPARVDNS